MSKIAKNAKTMLATLGLTPVKVLRKEGDVVVISLNNKTSEVNRAMKAFGGRRDADVSEGLLFAHTGWALPNGGSIAVMDPHEGLVNVVISAQPAQAVYYAKVASAFYGMGIMVTPADVEAALLMEDFEGGGTSISKVFKGRSGRFKRAVRQLMDRKTIAKYTELGYLTFAVDYRLGIGPKRVDGVNVSLDA